MKLMVERDWTDKVVLEGNQINELWFYVKADLSGKQTITVNGITVPLNYRCEINTIGRF